LRKQEGKCPFAGSEVIHPESGAVVGSEPRAISGRASFSLRAIVEWIASLSPIRHVVSTELKRETSRTPAQCSAKQVFGFTQQ
jgi:hypothetical protein